MVPIEATGFALLALCVILLAAVMFFILVFPRDAPVLARPVIVPVLAVVIAIAVYVLVTTRMR